MKLDSAHISLFNSSMVLLATAAIIPSLNDENSALITASMLQEMVDVCIKESEELQGRIGSTRKRRSPNTQSNKRRMVKYDRERAKRAVHADYLGPSPIFDDRQFARFFRITPSIAEWIVSCLAKHEPSFLPKHTTAPASLR